MDNHLKKDVANSRIIKGTLKKIKEDQRLIIYDLKTHLQGLTGIVNIHCEQSRNHLWDKLVLEKGSSI